MMKLALVLIAAPLMATRGSAEEPAVAPPAASAEALEFVQTKVQPLLVARCGECHGVTAEAKGGLQLTSRQLMLRGGDSGPALVPFDAEASLLISAVKYESFEMPPRSRMPDEEIAILERWIQLGAPWPQDGSDVPREHARAARDEFPLEERRQNHWAWQPVVNFPPPAVEDGEWCRQPVDRFIRKKLQDSGIRPAQDAERRAILRRLHFDLTGLPPTIAQQDDFLNDPASDDMAIARVADALLQSPHFGERWGRHWLDLVRYAETLGHEFDYPLPYAWKYRDYVIRAFNQDVPYRQIITEHIAGDLLTEPRRNAQGMNESIIATGFWFLGEDKHAPVDVKGEEAARVDNQIDVFSRAFLGMTVACARCHDHKFDAISTADYYALAGFLQSSRRRTEWLDSDGQLEQRLGSIQQHRDALEQALTREAQVCDVPRLISRLEQLIKNDASAEPGEESDDQSRSAGHVSSQNLDPLSVMFAAAQAVQTRRQDAGADTDPVSSEKKVSGSDVSADASSDGSADELPAASTPDAPSPAEQQQSLAASLHEWARGVQSAAVGPHTGTKLFADFSDGVPAGWLTYGRAWSRGRSDSGTPAESGHPLFRWTKPLPTFEDDYAVSSADLAGSLPGSLQSPTFTLEHPEILVLAAGHAARMRLVIDGYVMNEFSELLFRGARQTIDTDGQFRWIRLDGDVQRYLGHQCHLEFLDEGSGWFAVREVRFVLQPGTPPPAAQQPSPFNQGLAELILADPDPAAFAWLPTFATRLRQEPSWPRTAARLGLLSSASAGASSVPESDVSGIIRQNRTAWKRAAADLPQGDPVLVMCDGTGEDEHLFIRGSHRNPGTVVPRRFLTALTSNSSDAESGYAQLGSGRLRLARDVVDDQNPLTARVAVNRIWQHLFGSGLVASVDNFGVLGQPPTHPELLDHLTTQFQQSGWSVKTMIRSLVTSRTYRQSVVGDARAGEVDPTNALLHRANVRRLEGEVIRDAMLAVSGRLQPQPYGPSVPVYLTEFMQGRGRPRTSGPLDGDGRRSIYQAVHRNFLSPMMLAFDTPAPASTVGQRGASNVPAQALILLNNEFVLQQSRLWAQRLLKEFPAVAAQPGLGDAGSAGDSYDAEAILNRAFREALCRNCTAAELRLLQEFGRAHASEFQIDPERAFTSEEVLADVCHMLFNQKEFLFLD